MIRKYNNKKGQTALEYMLVIGVIVVGMIITSKFFFVGKDSAAAKLMESSIKKASETMTGDQNGVQ